MPAGVSFEDDEPTPAGPDPFELAWRDREVRDALLAAADDRTEWGRLLAAVGREHGFALLDLVTVIGAAARART